MSFVDWSDNGLSGKNLDESNDIHHCAGVFLKILSEIGLKDDYFAVLDGMIKYNGRKNEKFCPL